MQVAGVVVRVDGRRGAQGTMRTEALACASFFRSLLRYGRRPGRRHGRRLLWGWGSFGEEEEALPFAASLRALAQALPPAKSLIYKVSHPSS